MGVVSGFIYSLWIGTAVFVLLITMVVKLMTDQLLTAKWTRLLPVAAGMLLSAPVAWLCRSLSLNGVSMFWFVFATDLVFSYLGIRLAKRMSKKVE